MVISRPLSAPFPLPQYINVKLVYKNGTWEKLPCNAGGHVIDAHDPANWMTWEQACAAPETLGVGFVFTPGCGYFFLDLDNAWTGSAWSAAAVTITERFAGCALEVSHSGKGLHIFGRWTPMLHKSKGWLAAQRVELYTEGRFCLLTGAHWLGNAETDASAAVAALIAEAGLTPGANPVSPVTAQSGGDDAPLERFRLSALGEADDDTLIRAMLAAAGGGAVAFGEKISLAQLWNADEAALRKHFPETSARGFDWSSADASLMFHLAFWTGSHVSRMVRLFRRSPLYRPEKYEGRGAYRLALITGPAVSALNGRCYDRPRALGPAVAMTGPEELPKPIAVLDMLRTASDPYEWTVDRWIPHKQVTLISGDGGVGKTTLLIMLCLAAACIRPWLGMRVTPRKVLLVSAEDEYDDVKRRVEIIAKIMMVDGSNMDVVTLERLKNPELASVVNGELIPTPLFHHLREIIETNNYSMVVFDPVADIFGGNEIDRRQVRSFIRMCRSLNRTVLLSAHPSVDAMKTDRGYSGSTAWNNSVRSRLYFTADDNNPDLRELRLAKTNRARAGERLKLKWKDGVFVIEQEDGEANKKIDELFLTILRKRNNAGLTVSPNRSNAFAPVVFERDDLADGVKRDQFEQSMIRLLNNELIEIVEIGPASKRSKVICEKLRTPPSDGIRTASDGFER